MTEMVCLGPFQKPFKNAVLIPIQNSFSKFFSERAEIQSVICKNQTMQSL